MSKHSEWLKKRSSVKVSNEFETFSLPFFLLKVFTILNFLLVFIILVDFFLEPQSESATLNFHSKNQIELSYENYDYELFSVDERFTKTVLNESKVNVYFTPIFHYRKYFAGVTINDSNYQKNSYDYLIPISTIILNVLAFILIIIYPEYNDKTTRELDFSFTKLITHQVTTPSYFNLIVLLPLVFSIVHWYKLYKLLFNM